jgi:uncharacterized protein (UPF0261 family)
MVSGMVAKGAEVETKESQRTAARKPVVVASMFGNTTTCVDNARKLLTDEHGYEVLVFHSVGTHPPRLRHPSSSHQANGVPSRVVSCRVVSLQEPAVGRWSPCSMPTTAWSMACWYAQKALWLGNQSRFVYKRVFFPVQDLTTTEWADELCGGVFSSGPERLDRPGQVPAVITTLFIFIFILSLLTLPLSGRQLGIPHLIAPGCLDMVNFGARATVPDKYRFATNSSPTQPNPLITRHF